MSAALLPLGLVLAWAARESVDAANRANHAAAEQHGLAAARAIESLIARNALGLTIAANRTLPARGADACAAIGQSLALTPAIGNQFTLRSADGELLCVAGGLQARRDDLLVAPGDIRAWVSPLHETIDFRSGVVGGMVTGELSLNALRSATADFSAGLQQLSVADSSGQLDIIESRRPGIESRLLRRTYSIVSGQLKVQTAVAVERTTVFDEAAMLLPLVMWVVATLLSWWLVRRSLILPLGRLKRAVLAYQPGDDRLELPERLGPATEISELGSAFERAVDRIEQSERQMAEALEGQRRLVREVHHRVKNNLQVVASLLNIHRRSASTVEAGAAYAAIGRRVDALSVVHRNHFAEVEESRGIALRPLLVELGATLRASAPEEARMTSIQLDVDHLHTTQDAAVATAFFVTEVVEFAMLSTPGEAIEIELRRASELAARLTISSKALMKDGEEDFERVQFSRIIGGLARQLRSPLDEKIGRLSVDIPVFPD